MALLRILLKPSIVGEFSLPAIRALASDLSQLAHLGQEAYSRSSGHASTSSASCSDILQGRGICSSASTRKAHRWGQKEEKDKKAQWQALVSQTPDGRINPCNSKLHPAVLEGVVAVNDADELCVQEAYTPQSRCFGCGPAHPDGLRLQSKRIENGLEAVVQIPAKYCAFPGIVNGGILGTLLDCHGNWTSAITLMDRACLPKPPLTLTAQMVVTYKEPTPPDTDLLVRSRVVSIKETAQPGMGKATVEVETSIYLRPPEGGAPKLLVQGTGTFKRLGALRAL
eukprot:CAMPEP_0202869616 /NCGR_PEP_ID=MMETSP1391-20130828/12551_1 /ASSEMBLY_ACC=CAM_ASM_000867 /TAXON_ID=1034604 /ORGANISM="Chlamydomonas leiostraca, Strain SAG 11-49" /LENGTH=282 /DNA_ID=CAMNT_0049549953 /DNA_START=79 /DNA_END=927 /DNA_ORIENTATION=+